MSVSRERTVSLWMETDVAEAPVLDRSETADVVVVGSGIAGLSAAYELAIRGHDVVVLDRGPIGNGMTARTTAHLVSISDDSFSEFIKQRGEDAARLFYQSQSAAIDRIEAVQREAGVPCDFRRLDGFLFPALGSDPSKLDSEVEAARKLGVAVEKVSGLPFKGLQATRCLRYPDQATFHPLKYLRGLVKAITARGGRFYADTPVEQIEEDEKGIAAKTRSGKAVRAKYAVVATNSPINGDLPIHTKMGPYRTYAMSFALPRGAIPDALYWDTADPYHYVRLQPGSGGTDYLIVGGADHKSGEADDADVRFEALEAWMRNLVPSLGGETHRWSGQVLEPFDYAGFIGLNPGSEKAYIATGDSGQGITHGVVAGLLIADLIENRESPWSELYDPARKTGSAIGNFLSENVTALKNFAEYIAPGELSSFEELEPGRGAIIRQGLKKVAAYRDENGKLYTHSAACTHAGCHVHWNSLEQCWDCPCHGSQFAVDGTPLNAPAVSPLAEIGVETKRQSAKRPAAARARVSTKQPRGLAKTKQVRMAGSTKPQPGTRRAERYKDGAKKRGGVGATKHAGPGRASKSAPKRTKSAKRRRSS
jgi:glycine/D-amino acid oxidase-like deaminating enzyme/nitrite reductase/ring-hydroxylating ferredoxin subunit